VIVPMVTATCTSSTSMFAASRRGIWSGRSSSTLSNECEYWTKVPLGRPSEAA
jgi:hypothetical protein